jgi:hypothetical protein
VRKEYLTFAALVVALAVIAVSVSAVVGAMFYAGVWEPDPRSEAECECC